MGEDAELTVGLLAAKFDDEYPDSAAEWVADRAARSIKAAERVRLLASLLADRIEARRRQRARDIEQRAGQSVAPARIPTLNELVRADREAERRAFREDHAKHCDIPHADNDAGTGAAYACEARLTRGEGPRPRQDERVRMADAEKARLMVEDPQEYRRRYPSAFPTIAEALETFRQEVRLELTAELLGTTFALGDGRKTTWGRATIADHMQRVALLSDGIEGAGRTLVLHEKAIEILSERQAACLNDVRFAA